MTVKFGLHKPLCTFVYEWLISGTGKPISVATYFQSFGHARSRAQPLSWPVTHSAAGRNLIGSIWKLSPMGERGLYYNFDVSASSSLLFSFSSCSSSSSFSWRWWRSRKDRKEGHVLFNDALNTFYFTVIWRERNVLFNDALNTFYLRLYGVRIMVKDHSDSEKGNPLPPHRLLFPISSKGSFICIIPQTG